MGRDREIREEQLRREVEAGRTAGRPVDGSPLDTRRGGTEGGGQHLSRDDMRRAAKEGLIEREEELKGDGLYGSSTSDPILPAALAELVSTFILVFGGTAVATAAILSLPTAGQPYNSLAVALAFGLALAAVAASIGHVSGGHVNPAVTLGLASTGKFPWKSVPYYLGAQLLGAILGALGTWLAFGGPGRIEAKLAATYPAQGVGDLQAFLLEILITFILVFVVISVATDDRAPASIAPIAVGFFRKVGFKFGAWHDTRWFQLHLVEHPEKPVKLKTLGEVQNTAAFNAILESANKKLALLTV